MPVLQWNADLVLGLDDVDDEHITLVDDVAKLQAMVEARADARAIHAAMQTLLDRTRRHFRAEEAQMVECGYPDAATHAETHEDMLAEFRQQVDECRSGEGRAVEGALRFLVYWWAAHIRGLDRDFVEHFRRTDNA